MHAAQPTHYEGFYVYVPYANDFDQSEEPESDSDETHPENANFVNVAAPNFAPFFTGAGQLGQAAVNGPLGFGSQRFTVPSSRRTSYPPKRFISTLTTGASLRAVCQQSTVPLAFGAQ